MSITELIKIRYIKPLEALKEDALAKTILSFFAVAISMIGNFVTILQDIFRTPVELIILLIIAIIFDLITGIKSAKKNNVYIRSLGLRQTWVKIIEYAAGLILLSGIGNVFGNSGLEGWVGHLLSYLKNIHWLGYFYCIFTEFKSVVENKAGEKGRFSDIIDKINEKFFGEKDSGKIR